MNKGTVLDLSFLEGLWAPVQGQSLATYPPKL